MKRVIVPILIGALVASGCEKGTPRNSDKGRVRSTTTIEETVNSSGHRPMYRAERREIIIPGTFGYDIDSMKLSGNYELVQAWKNKDMEKKFDPQKIECGANEWDVDIRWTYHTRTKRSLQPENGAVLARLNGADFERVTLQELMSTRYFRGGIQGSDYSNQLTPGTVIAIKTKNNNFAKIRVDGCIPLEHNDFGVRDGLHCTLVLYKSKTH